MHFCICIYTVIIYVHTYVNWYLHISDHVYKWISIYDMKYNSLEDMYYMYTYDTHADKYKYLKLYLSINKRPTIAVILYGNSVENYKNNKRRESYALYVIVKLFLLLVSCQRYLYLKQLEIRISLVWSKR